jgi:heme exporter protein D
MTGSSEMPNGIASDPTASYARLWERVENQGRDIVDLRSNMNTGFRNLESSIHSLSNELRGSSKTQWPVIWSAIGVSFAIILAVGSQSLSPIKEALSEAKEDIRSTSTSALSVAAFVDFKNTYENNRIVSRNENIDKFNGVNGRVDNIEERLVPRAELDRVFSSYDQQMVDKQRQIDEMKQIQSGVYNQRDVIRDILERLDRAERERRAAM